MVTLDDVTRPGTYTMRKMLEDHGYENGLKVVTRLVQEADVALGGDGDPSRCVPTAANAMIGNGHRGLGFLVVAIREGMRRTDKAGKGFSKINAQLLNEWTAAQELAIADLALKEHAKNKFVDNGGKDYNDRLEYDHNADKRKIARLSSHVDALKAKLSNEGD